MSIDGKEIYHFGIIDYLQTWTSSKKAESCIKSTFTCRSRKELSAMKPFDYSQRFK